MSVKFTTVPSKILAESITSSATAFKLNNITGWDASNLASTDFGTQLFVVFRNATKTQMELMSIDPTTIASASITILARGLKFDGDLTTEVSANKLSWSKGDTYVDLGTDTPQMFEWLKEYIDTASIAGAVPATEAVQGITKLSTAAADPAIPIAVGDNDGRVPTQDENDALAGTSTPSASNKFVTEGEMVKVVLFSSSGTWTKPANLTYLTVELWGGGGAGGKMASGEGGGGGGGAFTRITLPASSLGATETVTVGAGGVAVTVDGAGTAGGNSSFGSHITAYGGGGGASSGSSAGGGGGGGAFSAASGSTAGSGGGATGGVGGTPYNGSSGTGAAQYEGGASGGGGDGSGIGNGGNAFTAGAGGGGSRSSGTYGTGGTSVGGGNGGAGSATTGTAGSVPGGGGGGGKATSSGAGGKGQVIVTEYFG